MNADGTNPVRLTNDAASDVNPAWSPDGSKIAFVTDRDNTRDGHAEIYVMNADGTNPVRLAGGLGAVQPAWSPDGSKIAFAGAYLCGGECYFALYLMNSDGSGVKELVGSHPPFAFPTTFSGPAWSPDGRWIAFAESCVGYGCTDALTNSVMVIRSDGTRLAQVYAITDPRSGPATSPSWRP